MKMIFSVCRIKSVDNIEQFADFSKQASHMKKKRRPHLAPRYTLLGDADTKKKEHALIPQQAELVREVFTSTTCRCFVLKSFSEANFHKSLKFGIWSTTTLHNALLDQIFKSDLTAVRPVLFFFRYNHTQLSSFFEDFVLS